MNALYVIWDYLVALAVRLFGRLEAAPRDHGDFFDREMVETPPVDVLPEGEPEEDIWL